MALIISIVSQASSGGAAEPGGMDVNDTITKNAEGDIVEVNGIKLVGYVDRHGNQISNINERMVNSQGQLLDGQLRMEVVKEYFALGRRNFRFSCSKSGRKLLSRHRLNARLQKSAMSKCKAKLARKGLNTDMRGLVCAVEGPIDGDADGEWITMESG